LAIEEANISVHSIRGIAFDATCSLAALDMTNYKPISITTPSFESERNVILWLDHRAVKETEKINATGHSLLRYVGGQMSVEMEIPKILWLKNNVKEKFAQYKFYDLADALTYMATGKDTRSFCSTVCKQGYVPIGVDNSTKGWQEDFFREIGLGDFISDEFERLGGIDGMVRTHFSTS
jgi:D-ribulokinase